MPGTYEGAIKAKETIYRKHGEDYFRNIGRIGGSAKVAKGFAVMDKEKVRRAGALGGSISRRGSRTQKVQKRTFMDIILHRSK